MYRITNIFCVLVVIVVFCIWANMAAAQIVKDGLVNYWTFDKGDIDGETVKDALENSDGTIGGDPKVVKGKIGEALEFDGDDYIDFEYTDTDDWTEISISAWFKTTVEGENARIAAKDQGGIPGNWIFWYSSNWQFAVYDDSAATWQRAIYEESLGDDNWHHIVGTVSQNDSKVYLYVDGDLVGSADFTASTLDDSDEETITIGADSDLAGPKTHLFNGTIDEVSIYDRALSEDEVRQNFVATSNTLAVVNTEGKVIEVWGRIKLGAYSK